MSERTAFIDAIIKNPDDNTARLIFADWLEENGKPERAEFIRLQIEAKELLNDGEMNQFGRADVLEVSYRSAWRSAIGLEEGAGQYERGFLTDVYVCPTQFHELTRQVLSFEPVTFELHLIGLDGDDAPQADSLAEDPLLGTVTSIWIRRGTDVKWFAQLMKSSHLNNLRQIRVYIDSLGVEGVKAITNAPAAFALESLHFERGLQGDVTEETETLVDAVKLIATSPRFMSLKNLSFLACDLGDRCILALLESRTLPKTMRLDLYGVNSYDEQRFKEALAARFGVESDKDSGDE